MKFKLFYCDFEKGLDKIPDNSISLILTDPPYGGRYLSLYNDLAKNARRILIEEGSLLCMMGEHKSLDILNAMAYHLTFQRNIAFFMEGSKAIIKEKKIQNLKKDIAWFTKGNKSMQTGLVKDLIISKEKDKKYHHWGQPVDPFKYLIKKLTYPKSVVVDPFLGGGAVGLASLSLKREFIGIDNDIEAINISRERLNTFIMGGENGN